MTRARNFADVISGNFAIPSGSLGNAVAADGSITTAKLANDAVTSAKIADDAVVSAAIADDAITSALIADNAVGSAALDLTANYSFTGTISGAGFVFASAQTITSGSSVTFTGIPSGTDIIKFGIWRESRDTTVSRFEMQIGDSGGIETSGYGRGDQYFLGSVNHNSAQSSSSWLIESWTSGANVMMYQGEVIRVNGNKWLIETNCIYVNDPGYFVHFHGYKELSGELTQMKFASTAGSFDDSAGVVRIGYQ